MLGKANYQQYPLHVDEYYFCPCWSEDALQIVLVRIKQWKGEKMKTHPTIYVASGTVKRSNAKTELQVSGVLLLDPTLRLLNGSPAPLPPGNNQFSYLIPGYSLCIYSLEQPRAVYHFSGSEGSLYIERTDQYLGDLMWFLENGSGVITSCFGEHFECYDSNMSDYDLFNQLAILPPFIRLISLQSPPDHPILSQVDGCNVMLTKMDRADVFEKGLGLAMPHHPTYLVSQFNED